MKTMLDPVGPKTCDADELRIRFVTALSEMYVEEVPLYGKLVDIVRSVDTQVLAAQGKSLSTLPTRHELERHGAIRLGTDLELRTIRRLFAIMGMYPVGYYDLGVVGFPLHATAFRPVAESSLQKNAFRIFTTLLRRDRLSPQVGAMAQSVLDKRNLFTPRLLTILDRSKADHSITDLDADDFISDSLEIFRWHSRSTVAMEDYLTLKQAHPIVADIVCFPSAHINHLTPRTLDIDLVQKEMIRLGLPVKERIEGPPARLCPILLRQTSFKALEEHVTFDFSNANGIQKQGTHTARFGEVEQRGAALTKKGRKLYDKLLRSATSRAATLSNIDGIPITPDSDTVLADTFTNQYPDSWRDLHAEKLAYFRYQPAPASITNEKDERILRSHKQSVSLEHLISLGLIEYEPITYEDFLPISAAGILQSNVGNGLVDATLARPQQDVDNSLQAFEHALGCQVEDEYLLYDKLQGESLKLCATALGLKEITID